VKKQSLGRSKREGESQKPAFFCSSFSSSSSFPKVESSDELPRTLICGNLCASRGGKRLVTLANAVSFSPPLLKSSRARNVDNSQRFSKPRAGCLNCSRMQRKTERTTLRRETGEKEQRETPLPSGDGRTTTTTALTRRRRRQRRPFRDLQRSGERVSTAKSRRARGGKQTNQCTSR
jgi:hypothetical protein